ncbi:von Willebrand factor type A [Pseudanabaena sp. ABRG5-3]|nr:von Willebrand factor type A [Pseudanabaena sp. ABRG5-3]
MREIDEGLRRSKRRDQFALEKRLAVRIEDLRRALLDEEPQFVHFCGHGAGHDGILLEDLVGYLQLVKAEPLANLFKLFSNQVECVILNACYSEVQAEEISRHINYVIGMKQAIGDQAAIKFSTGFYDAIGAGRSIEDAFEFGKNAIELGNIPEEFTPVIKKHVKLIAKAPESVSSVKWVIVLSATIDDINKPMAETIVKHLQQLSGDATLTLQRIEKGSVILTLQGSEEGFERINSLIQSGELKLLSGFRVEYVQIRHENGKNESNQALLESRKSRSQRSFALESIEFAANPEPRCPIILLIDKSGSMSGEPINALKQGLNTFKETLQVDSLATQRVEVAVVTFSDGVTLAQDFTLASHFVTPDIEAGGATAMGTAIELSLELIEGRKKIYRENGVNYYRPWIFMITDGQPTDNWEQAARRLQEAESTNRISFFSVGVRDADMEILRQISSNPPMLLNGLDFRSMFLWLSNSLVRVSSSKLAAQVQLPPVAWGVV